MSANTVGHSIPSVVPILSSPCYGKLRVRIGELQYRLQQTHNKHTLGGYLKRSNYQLSYQIRPYLSSEDDGNRIGSSRRNRLHEGIKTTHPLASDTNGGISSLDASTCCSAIGCNARHHCAAFGSSGQGHPQWRTLEGNPEVTWRGRRCRGYSRGYLCKPVNKCVECIASRQGCVCYIQSTLQSTLHTHTHIGTLAHRIVPRGR